MGLLKDFLRIEADRRGALAALRLETQSRRFQIDEIGAEAKRKRDEVAMIEELSLIHISEPTRPY